MQNSPNPFTRSTTLRYHLTRGYETLNHTVQGGDTERGGPINLSTYALINLSVYDVTGRLVKTLVDEKQRAGEYSVRWDGRDHEGREVPSGVYFYQLMVDGKRSTVNETRKAVLIR